MPMSATTRTSKYQLGRGLAAAQDYKLDVYDTDDAEGAYEHERAVARDIEQAGGWDDEVQRGYDEARADYARERLS